METRPLTETERTLARWMLENGSPEAHSYLNQLELAEATLWKCPCGCASLNFQIKDHPEAPPGIHVLAEYTIDCSDSMYCIFIYSSQGILSGIEVSGSGDPLKILPSPDQLRPCLNADGH